MAKCVAGSAFGVGPSEQHAYRRGDAGGEGREGSYGQGDVVGGEDPVGYRAFDEFVMIGLGRFFVAFCVA